MPLILPFKLGVDYFGCYEVRAGVSNGVALYVMTSFEQLFDCDSLDSWDASDGDALSVSVDSTDRRPYYSSSFYCLLFNIDVSLSTDNYALWHSTKSLGDLSSYVGVSSGAPSKGILSMWFKFDSTFIDLQTLEIRIGSDSSNYCKYTVDASNIFTLGEWKCLVIDLVRYESVVGTPAWTSIAYFAIKVTYSSSQADTNFRLDDVYIANAIDFTPKLKSIRLEGGLCRADMLKAELYSADTSDQNYISTNGQALIFIDYFLFSKCDLTKPKWTSENTVLINGRGSAGTLFADITPWMTGHNTPFWLAYGIITARDYGGDMPAVEYYIDENTLGTSWMNIKNLNRALALRLLALQTEYHYFIYHECPDNEVLVFTNDENYNSTPVISTYGSNTYAKKISYYLDTHKIINHLKLDDVQGYYIELYMSSPNWAIADPIDSILSEDISATDTTITMDTNRSDTQMPSSNFTIKIGSELITISSSSGDELYVNSRGAFGTTPATHSAGENVYYWRKDTSASDSLIDIYVRAIQGSFANTEKIKVGNEIITIGSWNDTTDTFENCTRGTLHGHTHHNILVMEYQNSGTVLTPDNALANSSIYKYNQRKRYIAAECAYFPCSLASLGDSILKYYAEPIPVVEVDLLTHSQFTETFAKKRGERFHISDDYAGIDGPYKFTDYIITQDNVKLFFTKQGIVSAMYDITDLMSSEALGYVFKYGL